MPTGAFLTKPEQSLLIEFTGAKGENYNRYLDFCDRHEIPDGRRYSEAYYHQWIHRHRPAIQMARGRHQDVVRSESTLDREKRLALLEEQVTRYRDDIRILMEHRDKIEEIIEEGQSGYARFRPQKIPDVVESRLKVEEALGKALDRIAKERGEFNRQAEDEKPMNANIARIEQATAAMGKIAAPQGRRADDIDGEFVYVETTP